MYKIVLWSQSCQGMEFVGRLSRLADTQLESEQSSHGEQ